MPTRTSSAPAAHRGRPELRPLQQGVRLLAYRALPDRRQRRLARRSLSYRDQTQFVSASSDFSSETIAAALRHRLSDLREPGRPLRPLVPEVDLLTTTRRQRPPVHDWVQQNGNPTSTASPAIDDGRKHLRSTDAVRHRIQTVELTDGVELRQPQPLAVRRSRHAPLLRARLHASPGSDVEYYVASYEFVKYVPLFGQFTLQLGPTSPTAWTSATRRPCRRIGSSLAAVRIRSAATRRAAWAPRTTSAIPLAATSRWRAGRKC